MITQYGMEPFDINIQHFKRTFIDKLFATGDYYLSRKIEGHSRHLYDLHMLYQHIAIDSDFIALFDIVRKEKSQKEICFSAKESQNILKILKEVINKDIYKKDYYSNTINLLKKPISYLETTITLNNIIERIEKQKNIYSKLY